MRHFGISAQGIVACLHFTSIVVVMIVNLFSFDPWLTTGRDHRLTTYELTGQIISILIFPVGCLELLVPDGTYPTSFQIGSLTISLLPINSLLWGYAVVWAGRLCSRLIRLVRGNGHGVS